MLDDTRYKNAKIRNSNQISDLQPVQVSTNRSKYLNLANMNLIFFSYFSRCEIEAIPRSKFESRSNIQICNRTWDQIWSKINEKEMTAAFSSAQSYPQICLCYLSPCERWLAKLTLVDLEHERKWDCSSDFRCKRLDQMRKNAAYCHALWKRAYSVANTVNYRIWICFWSERRQVWIGFRVACRGYSLHRQNVS